MLLQHKRVSAGGLDGWGWRDLKAFPEAWFDWLAVVLSRVELDGVWPDGLLDAYVTMIPKSDGDSTPLGQRPLCVLPVVYRIWASVRLRHLDGWLRSWLPLSVFSAGGGRGSVDAWYSTALDIEEVLSGLSESHVHVFVADVVKSFDTVDRGILDFVLGQCWVFLFGFVGFISVIMLMSVSGLSLPVVLVHLGLGMEAFLKVARLAWFLLLLFIFLGVGPWSLSLVSSLSFMLII